MKRLTAILFLLLPGVLLAQTFKKGLIMPNNDFEICCIFLPVNGLNIFDKPLKTQVPCAREFGEGK